MAFCPAGSNHLKSLPHCIADTTLEDKVLMAMTKNVVYILPEIGVIVQETALRWCELLNLETIV